MSNTNIPVVSPAVAIKAIVQAYRLGIAIMLWGPPGVAKTACVRSAAAIIEGEAREIYLSRMTAADVGGLPALDHANAKTTFYLPDLLTNVKDGTKGIMFFEELTTADPQTRAAAMNFLLERRLGDFVLPEGWSCVAAGNPKEYGGIYADLGAAMNNRVIHLEIDGHNIDAWLEWALQNDIAPSVLAFIRTQPNALMASPLEFERNPRAFNSPRSWEKVSHIVKNVPAKTRDEQNVQRVMIAGTIGEEIAAKYQIYLEIADKMRPINEILAAPDNALHDVLPASTEGLYTMMYAFAAVTSSKTLASIMRILTALETMSKFQEFRSLPLKDVAVMGWEIITDVAHAKNIDIEEHPLWQNYNNTRKSEMDVVEIKGHLAA